jgi:tRNA (cmo5U34)-methyltransferase
LRRLCTFNCYIYGHSKALALDHKPSHFHDPAAIATYATDIVRKVPGLADLHRMAMLLLAEAAPAEAQILVVGAGGGMETKAMAEAQAAWRFTGVDPSPAMLDLARQMLAPFADRVDLREGTIDQASEGPFDGATCLFTLHHLDLDARRKTLAGIRRRLAPGTRLVVAAHAPPSPAPERWIALSVAFGDRDGPDWSKAAAAGRMMTERLPLLTPAQEESMLHEAGFADVELFYAAFSFRGWVGTAG